MQMKAISNLCIVILSQLIVTAVCAQQPASAEQMLLDRFPGRSHRLVSATGWEELADYALAWSLSQLQPKAPQITVPVRAGAPDTLMS